MTPRIYSLLLLLFVASCSKSDSPSDSDKNKPNDTNSSNPDGPNKTGRQGSLDNNKAPQTVNARLNLQLFLSHAGEAKPPVTFVYVNPIFQKCVSCHGIDQRSPNLASFPFVGNASESLADVIGKIRIRVNSNDNPMPPTGTLPESERASINAWINAGYLSTPPAPAASLELSYYALALKWSVDGKESSANLEGADTGAFSQALGSVTIGSKVSVTVKVTGPRSIVVLDKTFDNLGVSSTGVIDVPMAANAVDTLPPTPGERGEIRSSNVTHNSISLVWTAADDAETSAADLRYSLYQSSTESLDSLEHIKSTGTLLAQTQTNLINFTVSSLVPSTKYFFNIIVSDSSGNEAAYQSKSFITNEDPNIVSEYPNCITVAQPSIGRLSAWRNAVAQDLQSGTSETTIAGRIRQCFPTQVPACVQPALDYATRKDIAGPQFDVSAANSPQKLPPSVFLAPNANGLEYVIPANVEQIAASNGWPVVRYKSRHAGGFDPQTPNLLMVYVPGDRVSPPVNFDRWLNFATPQDSAQTALTPLPQMRLATEEDYSAANNFGAGLPKVFTMVTLEKRVGARPAEVYFQMFDRQDRSSKFIPRANSDVRGCVSCHPNGLRAISPLGLHIRQNADHQNEAQLPEREWRAATEINAAMITAAGGKAVSWRSAMVNGVRKPLLNPTSEGPILGPVTPLNELGTRTEEFIMGTTRQDGTAVPGCFNKRQTIRVTDIFGRAPGANNIYTLSSRPNIRWEKVRDAMKCASCHDNINRGAINIPGSVNPEQIQQVEFKILVDQSMPLGAHADPLEQPGGVTDTPVRDDLTADERIALTNCLEEEFLLEKQQLKKSLIQTSCQ